MYIYLEKQQHQAQSIRVYVSVCESKTQQKKRFFLSQKFNNGRHESKIMDLTTEKQ